MDDNFWKNKRILITGGAGFIGKKLIERLHADNDIVVFSRDEAKHYQLKKKYPDIRFVVGDIRDYKSLKDAGVGCDVAIYAASIKQIETCSDFPREGCRTIIDGAFNSKEASVENRIPVSIFISTDKSRSPTTVYGALKFVAGEIFCLNNSDNSEQFISAIYGNVLNSTGSIIPTIWEHVKEGKPLPLYGDEMTRFLISGDDAVDLLLAAPDFDSVQLIPDLKSFKIVDLFEIYREHFGLKYITTQPRIGEKLHEILFSDEESSRVEIVTAASGVRMFTMSGGTVNSPQVTGELSSKDKVITRTELDELLASHDYFRP